ncbi:MAG: FG-GAP repeat protein, partial [Turneriella sp.]|nr:FG-GAP repeat protein [Turneriella sp.]
AYTVGGTVSGLSGTLVLQNNGGDDLIISTNGPFVFSTPVGNGKSYDVVVKTNPSGQICHVRDNQGTIAGANVTSIVVQCTGDTHWIQDAYLKASNAETWDYFRSSVAISGATVVVGASREDSSQTTITNNDGQPNHPDDDSASDSGAVYIFKAF